MEREGAPAKNEEMDRVIKERIDKLLSQDHMKHVREDIFTKLIEGRLHDFPDDYAILKNQVF